MAKRQTRTELNHRIKFGRFQSERNRNSGSYSKVFQEQYSVYFGYVQRSFKLQRELDGTKYEDTIGISIRHNPKITSSMSAEIGDVQYDIVDISIDHSQSYESFDVISLKRMDVDRNV